MIPRNLGLRALPPEVRACSNNTGTYKYSRLLYVKMRNLSKLCWECQITSKFFSVRHKSDDIAGGIMARDRTQYVTLFAASISDVSCWLQ